MPVTAIFPVVRETQIHLGEPPAVALTGVGVHGVASRTDVFRLPELWQLHLYQYEAELSIEGTVHLTRLFHAETGGTVVACIRRRRLERARHLLRATTLSIPAVAASVGIPDLQAFNKACRRELGASPRALRGVTYPAGAVNLA